MSKKGTVSASQLFCTLFVCRITSTFTFIVTDADRFSAGDRPLLFLPFFLLGLLSCVPAFLLMGKKQNGTLLERARGFSPAAAGITAAVYAAGAVWSAGIGLAQFEIFMSTVLFPGTRQLVLLGLMTASGVLIARRGLETLTRAGLPVLALTAVSLILVCVSVAKYFDAANLEPPLSGGVPSLLKEAYSAAARTGEIAALTAIAPSVKGNIRKGAAVWFAVFGLTASAVYTLGLGVTGAYGERQMFRLYALTVLSRFGVIERPDAAVCAVWVLCSLVRLAFYIYIAGLFLEQGFSLRARTPVYAALGLPILLVAVLLTSNATAFPKVIGSGVNEAVFTALAVVIPLAIPAAERIWGKMTRKEE